MQGDKGPRKLPREQAPQSGAVHIDGLGPDPGLKQRGQHGPPARERDLALSRAAAHEHRHPPEIHGPVFSLAACARGLVCPGGAGFMRPGFISLNLIYAACIGRRLIADDPHLGFQPDAMPGHDGRAHEFDQLLYLAGRGMGLVEDKVGVLLRDLGVPDRPALESAVLDQSGGMIAGRILEHRAAASGAPRLGGVPAPHEFGDHGLDRGPGGSFQLKGGGHEPLPRRHARTPVGDAEILPGAGAPLAPPVNGLDLGHKVPDLAAIGPGVHGQRAAHGARDAGQKLQPGQALLGGKTGRARAGEAGADFKRVGLKPRAFGQRPRDRDHGPAQAAVAHQQVAAMPDPGQRHGGRRPPDKFGEVRAIGRLVVIIGRPARLPGAVPRHRFLPPERAAQGLAVKRHAHAICPARAPDRVSAGPARICPIRGSGAPACRSYNCRDT